MQVLQHNIGQMKTTHNLHTRTTQRNSDTLGATAGNRRRHNLSYLRLYFNKLNFKIII